MLLCAWCYILPPFYQQVRGYTLILSKYISTLSPGCHKITVITVSCCKAKPMQEIRPLRGHNYMMTNQCTVCTGHEHMRIQERIKGGGGGGGGEGV